MLSDVVMLPCGEICYWLSATHVPKAPVMAQSLSGQTLPLNCGPWAMPRPAQDQGWKLEE